MIKKDQGTDHRFCSVVQSPDGSLYISDDSNGRIWKIIYKGKK